MFDAYFKTDRFPFLVEKENVTNLFRRRGEEVLRKTAVLVSDKFNIFIDSSDGINEDFPINEYCGRIKFIIKNFKKPFLYFKCNYSKKKTSDIKLIAENNAGKVLPFFMWNLKSQNPEFYTSIIPNRKKLIQENKNSNKYFDILFAAGIEKQYYPKPNLLDKKVAWSDYEHFGIGSPNHTGYFEAETRYNIKNKLSLLKGIKFNRIEQMKFRDYMKESLKYKIQFSPPGQGEYSCRMFNSAAIGQPPLLRKCSYDFYDSWKSYFPEIDLQSNTLEEDLQEIIKNYKTWGEKALFYFENHLSNERIWQVFLEEIELFKEGL